MPVVNARHGLVLVLVLVAAILAPLRAVALDQSDTMSQWLASSEQERSRLLEELRAKDGNMGHAAPSSVMACMNAAAEVAGHRALRIRDVAEACSQPSPPAPGSGQTDT